MSKTLEDYLKESLRKSSIQSYLHNIENYRKANRNADNYRYRDIMNYMELLRKEYQSGTVKMKLASIKKYYDYLMETGKRKDNPARAIKLKDVKENPIQLQDLFTEKELQKLLEPREERYPILGKRNKVIMSLLVYQALRPGEMEQLKVSDVNLEKTTIQISATGLTNSRELPLEASQILLLYQYINQDRNRLKTFRNDKNALLLGKLGTPVKATDIDYLISTYQKQSKKRLTTTTIRQSVITNLLAKNNDLRIVQYFAGHKSPDTTEKYRQTGLNALKTAIDKLHPVK